MNLDPDRPGPIDLLTKEQLKRYYVVYAATSGCPSTKHAAAWKAAVKHEESK